MNFSKRSPLMRSKEDAGFDIAVGELTDEINMHELDGIEGGSTWVCAASISAISASVAATYHVSMDVNDRLTKKIGCGVQFSLSFECQHFVC